MDNDRRNLPGHTHCDWVNGMRFGIVAGAIVGTLFGRMLGSVIFIWAVGEGAAGGFVGEKTAHRW